MIKKYFKFITLLFSYNIVIAQVGIGTTSPENTLDVNGWLKLGDQTSLTGSNTLGSIRYNSNIQCIEFYNGLMWDCIGRPKMQTFLINDGVNNTIAGNATNFNNTITAGYGVINNFTINNVNPKSRILFLIEIGLNTGKRRNLSYLNDYKIYGNGIHLEAEIPSTGGLDTASFFVWGEPNNIIQNNLTFTFECNQSYNNVKITTIVF